MLIWSVPTRDKREKRKRHQMGGEQTASGQTEENTIINDMFFGPSRYLLNIKGSVYILTESKIIVKNLYWFMTYDTLAAS